MRRKLKAVDLFCGAGGTDAGGRPQPAPVVQGRAAILPGVGDGTSGPARRHVDWNDPGPGKGVRRQDRRPANRANEANWIRAALAYLVHQ